MDSDSRARVSAHAPAPGAVVGGRVRLERPLASGAMGSVWTGHHLALDVAVAVKFIRPEVFVRDPRAEQRFEREARAAARIKSPHVVQTFDCGITEDGAPYLVMELLEGETLGQRLDRAGPLSPAAVVAVVSQVGRALDRAHALGIVHRDVKPQNIFLVGAEPEPLAKLLDFGIAKLTEMPMDHAATQTGVVVGTPQYMSPEQLLRPKEADHRGDLWALAVVAYHALAGCPPFTGETLAALIVSITQSKFARVRTHRPELPASVDAWFDRALGIEPDARFATAAELAETLAAALTVAGWSVSSTGLRIDGDAAAGDMKGAPGSVGTEALALDGVADTAAFVAARELDLADVPRSARGSSPRPTEDRPDALRESAAEPPAASAARATDPVPSAAADTLSSPPAQSRQAGPPSAPAASAGLAPWWRRRAPLLAVVAVGLAAGGLGLRSAATSPTAGALPSSSGAGSARSASPSAPRTAPTTVDPTASARPGASASPDPDASAGATELVAPTDVPAGRCAETNAWLPKFTVARYEGSRGRSWLEALDECRERGSSLCTESQWARACETLGALGSTPTWTASAAGERGFVVRGGRGCTARQVVPGHETDDERSAACCTRAVGLRSDSSSTAFLQTTAARLLVLERALEGLDGQTLADVLATDVDLGGETVPRADVVARLRKQLGFARERGAMHDVCEVRLTTFAGDPGWTAECQVVMRVDRSVGHVLRRYLYGGPDGKLRSVGEPKVYRLPAPLAPAKHDAGP